MRKVGYGHNMTSSRIGGSPPEETHFCPSTLKKIWRLIFYLLPPKPWCQTFREFVSFPVMYVLRGSSALLVDWGPVFCRKSAKRGCLILRKHQASCFWAKNLMATLEVLRKGWYPSESIFRQLSCGIIGFKGVLLFIGENLSFLRSYVVRWTWP